MNVSTYSNGWSVYFERIGDWYHVLVRDARGDVHDKVRCDSYREASDYRRAFKAIAKNA